MYHTKQPSHRRTVLDEREVGRAKMLDRAAAYRREAAHHQAATPGIRVREARRLTVLEAKRDRLDTEARKIRKALGLSC